MMSSNEVTPLSVRALCQSIRDGRITRGCQVTVEGIILASEDEVHLYHDESRSDRLVLVGEPRTLLEGIPPMVGGKYLAYGSCIVRGTVALGDIKDGEIVAIEGITMLEMRDEFGNKYLAGRGGSALRINPDGSITVER